MSEGDTTRIRLELIRDDAEVWPRRQLDYERVAAFVILYSDQGLDALPPLELVPDGEGEYHLADGHHRLEALYELGADEAPAVITDPPDGLAADLFAFERALKYCATAAKPLTQVERRVAVLRLIAERPELSDREIGRLTGTSHQTVGRVRKQATEPAPIRAEEDPGAAYLARITADEIARRVVGSVSKLWAARGVSDLILGDRTGHRIAIALRETQGEQALVWARRLQTWTTAALQELERGGAP